MTIEQGWNEAKLWGQTVGCGTVVVVVVGASWLGAIERWTQWKCGDGLHQLRLGIKERQEEREWEMFQKEKG